MNYTESKIEEDGIEFTLVKVNMNNGDTNEIADFIRPGFCKIIYQIGSISRIYYFKNGIETSKEKILQDERMKQLRR